MSRIRCLLLITLLPLVGFLVGYLPMRVSLNRCQRENAMLTKDLKNAVVRGVLIETQLNLCQEGKK